MQGPRPYYSPFVPVCPEADFLSALELDTSRPIRSCCICARCLSLKTCFKFCSVIVVSNLQIVELFLNCKKYRVSLGRRLPQGAGRFQVSALRDMPDFHKHKSLCFQLPCRNSYEVSRPVFWACNFPAFLIANVALVTANGVCFYGYGPSRMLLNMQRVCTYIMI